MGPDSYRSTTMGSDATHVSRFGVHGVLLNYAT